MKFSENWLRAFVNPPISANELADALTMAGLEVEAVEAVAPDFEGVVVAEVLAVQKHPDADHLAICRVDTRTGPAPLQIVCGARNVRAGIKVPCALPGARLGGNTIRHTRIRGAESGGMLCSAKELGLQEDVEGLLVLPQDAPEGADFREYYELDDRIFTLKLTPNRGDCLGMTGIAREVAAINGETSHPIRIRTVAIESTDELAVRIEAPDACPLYYGRVIRDISMNVSAPKWMVRRLERSGLRSINPVVDVANYVMLEMGQPLHAFDLARISGGLAGTIRVRYAEAGEKIQLLNCENLMLQPDMLVISDGAQPLALAGIMGGSDSGVTNDTTDIFLESAFFSPPAIAGRSFTLGFSSDSAHRFERGVDFGATRDTMERASELILDICGGKAGPITETRGGALPRRDPIWLRPQRTRRVLGIDLDEAAMAEILRRLQFAFEYAEGSFRVLPPTYRFDIVIEEDLIEELARVHGYNRIPSTLPAGELEMLSDPETRRTASQLRQVMVDRDYQEVINYGFVETSWELELSGNGSPVDLKNPLSSQMEVMRSSLLGGLISNLKFNLNHKQARVRLFETGRCFWKDSEGYLQREMLGGLCYGDTAEEQWGIPARPVDFYDVKGDLEALCWPVPINAEPAPHPALHPGKSARISVGGRIAGYLGELHPRLQRKFDLPRPPILFELELDALVIRTLPRAEDISKYPSIRRDIAVVVDEDIDFEVMLVSMKSGSSPIISDISLFDLYRGKGVGEGKKSLAFRILLQDTEKTLTDAEADMEVAKLLGILEERFNAALRN